MRYNIIVLFVSIFFFCSCSNSHKNQENSSWEIHRSDAALTGFSKVTLSNELSLEWSYKTKAYTVSSPVISNDGNVYWANKKGDVYKLSEGKEGGVLISLDAPCESSPLIIESKMYIGDVHGTMHAISLQTNQVLWTFEAENQITGSANEAIVNGESAIFFGSYDYYLYCLNAESGDLNYKIETENFINGTPSISDGFLYFGGCDALLRSIDLDKKTQVNSVELDAYIPSSPSSTKDEIIVSDYAGCVYSISKESFKDQPFHQANTDEGQSTTMPALDNDAIYISAEDQYLYCYEQSTKNLRWKRLMTGKCDASPVVCQNAVITCSKQGFLELINKKDGQTIWTYDIGEPILSNPAITHDGIYIMSSRGTLYKFSSDTK